ncbi:FMN-binding protein [Ekhidna sp.]|uniref:FMN-binding protein n=1 Tax=Ekhidna sp. TaxID=2608089 RepID=UPI003B507E15
MSESQAIPTTNSFTMLRAMVGIGILCGILIVFTYEGTLPRIERLRAEALEQAIFNVVPGIESTKAFAWEDGQFSEAGEGNTQIVYAGYDTNGEFKGVAIEASGQGYADIIRILYGYDPATQKVVGFYVLESKETPGLGDKIEKDQVFLENFQALDVTLTKTSEKLVYQVVLVKKGTKSEPWQVDGITGATISSRAIGNIIGESTTIWVPRIYQHQQYFQNEVNE